MGSYFICKIRFWLFLSFVIFKPQPRKTDRSLVISTLKFSMDILIKTHQCQGNLMSGNQLINLNLAEVIRKKNKLVGRDASCSQGDLLNVPILMIILIKTNHSKIGFLFLRHLL